MTDQTVGLPSGGPRTARLRTGAARLLQGTALRPATSWAIATCISATVLARFWTDEGSAPNVLFTAAVTGALIAMVVVLTRRVLFASALVGSLVALIITVSSAKRATMNMVMHAYDIVFYMGSWSTISYLWSDQRRYLIGLACGLAGLAVVAWLAYRADGTRVSRRWSVLALPVCITLAWYGAAAKGERRHMQFYYENLYVSSFYASWGETLEALWRGALLEAAPKAAAFERPFAVPSSCEVGAKPPHIILIHEESVVQPSLFPTLRYDQSVDPFFRS